VLLGGLVALLLLSILSAVPNSQLSVDQQFMGIVTLLAFALIGVIGGGYGLYHSIRSVFLRRPSAPFALPTFWLFVALYLVVIAAGYILRTQGQDVANVPLTVFLILLAGLMPALAVLSLGDRRLRYPKGIGVEKSGWPTTWRRFALAIVSGATAGVLVAGTLEFLFQVALVRGQGIDPYLCLTNPNAAQCQNPQVYNLLLIAVALVAPLIEEAVKPLAAVILIGRVRSAAEAFVLGLSCGVGFDLIETSGYISASYNDWLSTALIRSGAGLLHGFGAAMVVLGWYYLTHPGKNRLPKALGCWLYAVAQHAIWNGSWGVVLLPGSIGQFFNNTLTIGSISLPYYAFINIGEAIIMLVLFLYMTGRLRRGSRPAAEIQQAS
jgi:RsiW-degrading membrane proteinase PrsW (M82 family)